MGKNKLHMVGKKTQKKKRRTKKLTKKDKKGIVDAPIARELSQGSKASLGSIDYHYQKYDNLSGVYLDIVCLFQRFRYC